MAGPRAKIRGAVALLASVALCAGVRAQVFTHTPELTIPDWPTVTDQMVVSGGPSTITDVNVILDIAHADLSQLDILLIPPGGTQYLVLAADTAGPEGYFDHTRFDDDACRYVYNGSGTFSASYRPRGGIVIPYLGSLAIPPAWMGALSDLHGTNANGTWTVLIDDDTNGGTGVLHSWSLEFNGAVSPTGPQDMFELCTSAVVTPSVVRHGVVATVRVNVTPRTNPVSSLISVIAQPDALGAGTIQLFDDGLHDDGAAGDHVFGGSFVVPANAPVGVSPIGYVAQDAQGRTGLGSLDIDVGPDTAWFEDFDGGGDAGDLPELAQAVNGPGRTEIRGSLETPDDVDMYSISICDPAQFFASTEHVTPYDTQLFLFFPDGHGVVMNDDAFASYQSRITSTFVLQPGAYMLAIARYDRDPVDAGFSEIWDDVNYIFEQQPDGPGAPNPVAGWNGLTFNPVGPYTITIQGVDGLGACPQGACDSIDFNNDTLFPDTADVDDFLVVFGGGLCSRDPNCGDIDFNNDGLFPDVADITVFLKVFSGGQCAW